MKRKNSAVLIGIIPFLVSVTFMRERLFASEYKYEAGDRRDPFIPLVMSEQRISMGLETVETVDDVKFEGVIFDPSGSSMAVLNGEIVKEGEKIHNVEIVKIDDNSIALKIYDKVYTIGLIEKGGE